MYVYRYCKRSAMSGEAQNVSAPTIFRHLQLYTSKRSVDLFIVQAKMGPRNLFIYLMGTNSTAIRGKVIQ